MATSFSGEYDAATLAHVERLKRFGKPVAEGIAPILALVDEPRGVPLSAFVEGRRVSPDLDPVAAARLADLTHNLLRRHS